MGIQGGTTLIVGEGICANSIHTKLTIEKEDGRGYTQILDAIDS